jgi:hypothetical protein
MIHLLAVHVVEVRLLRHGGQHLLTLSSSHFGPLADVPTSTAQVRNERESGRGFRESYQKRACGPSSSGFTARRSGNREKLMAAIDDYLEEMTGDRTRLHAKNHKCG